METLKRRHQRSFTPSVAMEIVNPWGWRCVPCSLCSNINSVRA